MMPKENYHVSVLEASLPSPVRAALLSQRSDLEPNALLSGSALFQKLRLPSART